MIRRRNRRSDGDADYLERTTLRLRRITSTYSGAAEADAAEFASRLRARAKGSVWVQDGHIAGAA